MSVKRLTEIDVSANSSERALERWQKAMPQKKGVSRG